MPGLSHRACDPTLSPNMHVICNGKMTCHAYLTGNNASRADAGTTRNAGLSSNRSATTDACAVRNLNHVIDDHSVSDYRVLQCATVDSLVSADLNIIADNHTRQLFYLDPSVRSRRKAESIRAYRRVGMNHAPLANGYRVTNNRAWLDHCIATDDGAVSDVGSGANPSPIAQ